MSKDSKTEVFSLAALLSPSRIVSEMAATEHWEAIVELVDRLVTEHFIPAESRETILAALKAREEDSSTGIGNGIAIPHCFSEDISDLSVVFGRSKTGIDFCAVDRAPVFFVVLFVVPKSQYALHLKTLAAIARVLNSALIREKLAKAKHSREILDILD